MAANSNKEKILSITQLSILTALIIVMAFTPIGYIKTAGLEITLITVPVIIGAVIINEKAGAFLGLVFGITSFLQAVMGLSAFGAMMFQTNPIGCFVTAVPTRVLVGLFAGLVHKALKNKAPLISDYISGLIGALSNTVLFMGALIAFYWKADFIQEISVALGTSNILLFVIAFVGINGLVEAVCCTILAGTVCKALKKIKIHV